MTQKQPNAWKSGTPFLLLALAILGSIFGVAMVPRLLVTLDIDPRPLAQACTALSVVLVAEMAGWFDTRAWRCTGFVARLYKKSPLACRLAPCALLFLLILHAVSAHDAYQGQVPVQEFALQSVLYPLVGGVVLCLAKPLLPRLLYLVTLGCSGTNDTVFHERLGISYEELFK